MTGLTDVRIGESAGRIEDDVMIRGRIEIGMVENVKDFRSELHVERFRDARYVRVLDQGHIEIDDSGADHAVTPGIAHEVGASAQTRRPREGRALCRDIGSSHR